MGGGRQSSDHLPAVVSELADDGVTSSQSSSDRHPDDSPLSYSPEITVAATDSATEEEVCYNPPRRKTYNELLESYSNPPARKATLRETKDLILRHKPGDWIEEVGGTTVGDYEVSDCTTLLLIGPRGSGKSTLINRITMVFEDDQSTPHRAQVSHNLSATLGTCFLQEYMIPRKSKSLCIYDTRSLSSKPSDNVELLQCWMTRGVSHGEMVIRQSDDIMTRNTIKSMVRQGVFSPCKKRVVNFVILVVNGVSILESIHAKDNGYVDILLETFKYPFLSFKDNKPALVITHGDELSISQRACVRMYLGELLGIPPVQQIFDIADMKDEDTELAIVDMLRYCIEHADRNLPFNQNYLLQGQRICHSMMEMLQGYDTILEVVVITLCIILLLLRGIVNLI
ncbi:uncharacterized protein LOC122047489 isoform X1 [Zingiber officinale]|uniref:uncharacterized protein LOC122047489 isoform X1 n=1 Tax=Zingiber officinale TaxID=94328 RepID=UPI001C4D0ED2|nr:uncharacterized protein LOC122047489 isoform X1 [Zingiber officinale]